MSYQQQGYSTFSQLTSLITNGVPLLVGALVGFYMYSNVKWCDMTLGKATKSKCDMTKKVLFAVLVALIVMYVMVSRMPQY